MTLYTTQESFDFQVKLKEDVKSSCCSIIKVRHFNRSLEWSFIHLKQHIKKR